MVVKAILPVFVSVVEFIDRAQTGPLAQNLLFLNKVPKLISPPHNSKTDALAVGANALEDWRQGMTHCTHCSEHPCTPYGGPGCCPASRGVRGPS